MFDVDVVSAERRLFQGHASEVYARSVAGEIGLLKGHEPVLLALDISPLRLRFPDEDDLVVAVHGGVLELRDDRLTVLAEVAELADEIDLPRAEAALERAQQRLREEPDSAHVRQLIARAETRLRCVRGQVGGAAA
ncbi:ATP synthase F1 subunit epsilon [Egibacter rhizosphaerae]|uniref:ATP synthase epsilon chain n=1 Tax=Egibacter rhizosphaerae TaxID=1670831 RepID=A0A411YD16_9ACTN|nr:ATP synthase F1 subunit epsilon [Egibacter rhizosphaerae]QBI19114.1 ATP synthase F1 subunit epsilon [Egibacter rhizosphaerae]